MRVTLLRGTDACNLSCSQWAALLLLAKRYGWKPAGTRQPFYFAWPDFGQGAWNASDYTSSMGQLMVRRDAANLARALAAAEAEGEAVPQGLIAFCGQGGFHLWDSSAVAEEEEGGSSGPEQDSSGVPFRRVA